jgi:hypothetical protein
MNMQLIAGLLLTLVSIAQAGLLGDIVGRDESEQQKPSDNFPSESVGLLSGVGGISHKHNSGSDEPEGSPQLLLAGIGGISASNQGAAQLALRDSLEKEDDSSNDKNGENKAAEAEVGPTT